MEGLDHRDEAGCARQAGDRVEIPLLEDVGDAVHEDVSEHAAAHAGEEAHHDAGHRIEVVAEGLVGAHHGEEPHGEDVEDRDGAVGFLDEPGEDEDDRGRRDGDGQGERLVEQVDIAALEDDIAQEAAAKPADDGYADGSDEIELVLAGAERPGPRGDHDGEHLDGERNVDKRGE